MKFFPLLLFSVEGIDKSNWKCQYNVKLSKGAFSYPTGTKAKDYDSQRFFEYKGPPGYIVQEMKHGDSVKIGCYYSGKGVSGVNKPIPVIPSAQHRNAKKVKCKCGRTEDSCKLVVDGSHEIRGNEISCKNQAAGWCKPFHRVLGISRRQTECDAAFDSNPYSRQEGMNCKVKDCGGNPNFVSKAQCVCGWDVNNRGCNWQIDGKVVDSTIPKECSITNGWSYWSSWNTADCDGCTTGWKTRERTCIYGRYGCPHDTNDKPANVHWYPSSGPDVGEEQRARCHNFCCERTDPEPVYACGAKQPGKQLMRSYVRQGDCADDTVDTYVDC